MGPSFILARVGGIPVRIHWSAPFGALFFGGASISGALAWLVVVLVHEGGHALLARRFGNGVVGLSIHAFGGECQWRPSGRPWSHEIVAWGGVLAQVALFFFIAVVARFLPIQTILGARAIFVLTAYNLGMAAFNLLPFGGLDGRRAWRLLLALRWSDLRAWQKRRSLDRQWGESRAFQRKLRDVRSSRD